MVHSSFRLLPKEILRQGLLGSVGFARGLSEGGVYSFNIVLKHQLKYDHSITLNSTQLSWVLSGTIHCMVLSRLFCCVTLHFLGRKGTMLAMDTITFLSWLLIYFCENVEMLILARLLAGISMGQNMTIDIVIFGELSSPEYRTILLTAPYIGWHLGFFICEYFRYSIHWKTFGIIYVWFAIYSIVILLNLKESFVTYIDRGNVELARKHFQWYRGLDMQAVNEFEHIVRDQERNKHIISCYQKLQLCKTREFLSPLCTITAVYIVNKLTGIQAMMYFTEEIISEFSKDVNFSENAILLLGIVRLLAILSSIFIVKLCSARFMILSSGYIICLSLLALGGFIHCSRNYEHPIFPILALTTLVINVIMFWVGLGAFTPLISGELFPFATRTIGISISSFLSIIFLDVFIQFLPSLIFNIGLYCTMTMFGLCTFCGIIVVHLTLPETKNKTLLEINKLYKD